MVPPFVPLSSAHRAADYETICLGLFFGNFMEVNVPFHFLLCFFLAVGGMPLNRQAQLINQVNYQPRSQGLILPSPWVTLGMRLVNDIWVAWETRLFSQTIPWGAEGDSTSKKAPSLQYQFSLPCITFNVLKLSREMNSYNLKLLTLICWHTQASTQPLVRDWTVSCCPKVSDILIYR